MPPKKQVAAKGAKGKAKAHDKEEKKVAKVTKNQPKAAVVAPKKAGKKEKRQKKPKDAPKKPMSAFFCYQGARRQALKNEAPQLNHKDIIKRMSEEWKTMSDAQRVQYQAESDRAKERYDNEMRAFKEKMAKADAQEAADKPEKIVGQKRKAAGTPKKEEPAAKPKKQDEKKPKAGKGGAPKGRKPAADKAQKGHEEEKKHVEAQVQNKKKPAPAQAPVQAQPLPVVDVHQPNGEPAKKVEDHAHQQQLDVAALHQIPQNLVQNVPAQNGVQHIDQDDEEEELDVEEGDEEPIDDDDEDDQ